MFSHRPDILLFDLGGVLVENVIFDELPKLLPISIEDDELRSRWLFSPSDQAFERGQIAPDEFALGFAKEWELEISPDEFLEHFASWPRGPFPGALELIDRVMSNYRVALLTNCNAIHWDRMAAFRDRAHACFSSHLLGLVKPDSLIFERVADELKDNPEAICFFDDSLQNVEAARRIGMRAYQARGARM